MKDLNYIIGLLAADGCTRKQTKNSYASSLELKDEQIIKDLANEFEIKYRTRKRIINDKERIFHSINIPAKKLVHFRDYLLNDKKELFKYYKTLCSFEKSRLIHGLFDGDGSVSMYKNRCNLRVGFTVNSNHESILNILKDFMRENDIYVSIYFDKRGNGAYNFSVGKKLNVYKLFNLFYKNDGFRLDRKYYIFQKYFTSENNEKWKLTLDK